MSNVLEYILKLRDNVTPMLERLERQAEKNRVAFNKLKVGLNSITSSIPGADFLTNPYVAATAAIGFASKVPCHLMKEWQKLIQRLSLPIHN